MSVRESLISIVPVAPGEVLVCADDEGSRKDAARHLTNLAIVAEQADSGPKCLEIAAAKATSLDCVVLDLSLAGGLDVMKRLHADPETANIPLVVLLDRAPTEPEMLAIVECGADPMQKPISGMLFCAKVRAVCDRARGQRELKNKLQFALENAAHDPLTGLFNRRYFERRLREESAHARRHRRPFALVMIDLDHFKLVNDTYGHDSGDRVLRHVAEVTTGHLREDDIACRYGGEEFVLLLRATSTMAARIVANRLRAALAAKPIALGPKGEPRHVTFSAGVAAADDANGFAVDGIMARADQALYRAKRGGRNRVEAQ